MALRTIPSRGPAGRRRGWSSTIGGLCLLLAVFSLTAADLPATSPGWQMLWSEDFESWDDDGWDIRTYGPTDRLVLARENSGKCQNYMLKGESTSAATGSGYRAATPTFEQLGLDPRLPYSVEFRYQLPTNCFCWTYAMATRDAALVVAECDGSGQRARIGLVDHLHGDFKPLGVLNVGQWYDIKVAVRPIASSADKEVRVFVDGNLRGIQRRSTPFSYDRVLFMDLPARIAVAEEPLPNSSLCYGSGYWDEIRVWSDLSTPQNPEKDIPDIEVAPNPFNPATQLSFNMERAGLLHVDVYDLSGRHVTSLFGGPHASGLVQLMWHGRNDGGREVASGVYLIRVATPTGVRTNRAVLVR